jgi:hypothetical protein
MRDYVNNEYFEWLSDLVCGERYSGQVSYRKLLIFLHDTSFRYSIPMDANRAADGVDLRRRFALSRRDLPDAERYLDAPCSVLEMMVALSIRCEEDIMDDPEIGDRTGQWFWGMVVNLGLGSMVDARFQRYHAYEAIERFLNREYESNGKGGLFTIYNCADDLRDVEIWNQLNWYIDSKYM